MKDLEKILMLLNIMNELKIYYKIASKQQTPYIYIYYTDSLLF